MIPEDIIVVDANAVCWQVQNTLGRLTYKDVPTGMAFGFLRQVIMLADLFQTGKFVFVWDSRGSLRKDKYSWYKAKRRTNRSEAETEMYLDTLVAMSDIRQNLLPSIGFLHNFCEPGYEGDDLIASVVKNNSSNFIVVSDDADLYQLLDDCDIFLSRKKQRYTRNDLIKEHKLTPDEWKDFKAICGCPTDSVPGVPDFGPVRTVAYLRKEELSNNLMQCIGTEQSQAIIKRNRWLTGLPLPGTPKLFVDFADERLSSAKFEAECHKRGIRAIFEQKSLATLNQFFFADRPLRGMSASAITGLRVRRG